VRNIGGSNFPIMPRPLRGLLEGLSIPARGMSVQQSFLDAIASNLANSETTRTPEGGPYKRKIAVVGGDPAQGNGEIKVVEDETPGETVYDPGHPDANAQGFVTRPNVDVNRELVDLMIARRVHEANATVFHAAKAMLSRALDI